MTVFLNPTENLKRFGKTRRGYISWSGETALNMRIPAAVGEYRRAELRSPILWPIRTWHLHLWLQACMVSRTSLIAEAADLNFYKADAAALAKKLRRTCNRLQSWAASDFIENIPAAILDIYWQ